MKHYTGTSLVFALLLCCTFGLRAQSLPVGTGLLEDYYRRTQLLGGADSLTSFTVRPLFQGLNKSGDIFYPESDTGKVAGLVDVRSSVNLKNSAFVQLLPLSWQQQLNSDHPAGLNDGAMIPAKGYQSLLSGGVYARLGPLDIQLRPEFLFAGNSAYDAFPTDHYDILWKRYFDAYLNYIDLPEHFGEDSYNRASWGQSSIRLNWKGFSAGLSNENLWWGPGKQNSLLMTNTSRGFKHITLNTLKPILTPVGSFEGQMIAGRLENSGFLLTEPNRIYNGVKLYQPLKNDWRYISGFVLTYQPKWVPGLFLGASRSYQMYNSDKKNSVFDYIPLVSALRQLKTDDGIQRDQLASVFARWMMKDAHAEIYAEYGINDYGYIPLDYLLEEKHSRAFIWGFRKILPLTYTKDAYISINLELTQLEQKAQEAASFYTDGYIRQGYTHGGELLGAGIGPGSSMQTLDLSWFKGLKKLGLQLGRYVHNNDYYYYAYADTQDPRKHWVDFSLTGNVQWNYKNVLFDASTSVIRSSNYQYVLVDRPGYFKAGRDVINLQVKIGTMYRF